MTDVNSEDESPEVVTLEQSRVDFLENEKVTRLQVSTKKQKKRKRREIVSTELEQKTSKRQKLSREFLSAVVEEEKSISLETPVEIPQV